MKVVVLSDMKPGHYNQSLGIVQSVPDCNVERIDVKYQHKWRDNILRIFLTVFAKFPLPTSFIKSVLHWSLDETTYNNLITIREADIILSTGSSVAGINILLGKILHAKTVTCRRPSLIGSRHFDLAILPMFSWDNTTSRNNVCKTTGVPNTITPNLLNSMRQHLKQKLKLQEVTRIGILLGGTDKHETVTLENAIHLTEKCQTVVEKMDAHILITTSRRTPPEVTEYLKSKLGNAEWCPLFIESDKPTEYEYPYQAILALSDLLIITADSFSMVCEAASSGRKALVLKLTQISTKQPKRYRVYEYMEQNSIVNLCKLEELEDKINDVLTMDVMNSVLTDTQKAAKAIHRLLLNR